MNVDHDFSRFFSKSFVMELGSVWPHILSLSVADSRCPGI